MSPTPETFLLLNDAYYRSDLFTKFLDERRIFLFETIDAQSAKSIIAQLQHLDDVSDDPITLVISSPGGEISAGFAILDAMRSIQSPIYTVGTGMVASMAAVLLACGDKRYATPLTCVMVHQPLGGAMGQASDIEITARQILKLKDLLNTMLAEKMGKSVEDVAKLTDRDTYLDAQEALAHGLIDEITPYQEKKEA
jgi:ATP-dependent Clp protease protease subunit